MTNRLSWSKLPKDYRAGLAYGVFYPADGPAEAWDGLVAITEDNDSENSATYIDGQKVVNRRTAKSFSGSISAFTYSESFEQEVFTTRRPRAFGLSYRVYNALAYKIHLVYNVLVAPSPVTRKLNEVNPFEWAFTTTPAPLPEGMVGAHLIIDPAVAYPWTLEALENVLYGTDTDPGRLPSPMEVYNIFEVNSILQVAEYSDGTYTVTGPDDAILMLDADTFEISWPSAELAPDGRFTIYSL